MREHESACAVLFVKQYILTGRILLSAHENKSCSESYAKPPSNDNVTHKPIHRIMMLCILLNIKDVE